MGTHRAILSPRALVRTAALTLFAGAAAVTAAWWMTLSEYEGDRTVRRTEIVLPPSGPLLPSEQRQFSISGDGESIVYVGSSEAGLSQLFVRSLDDLNPRPLARTIGARMPVISPSGNEIAFARFGPPMTTLELISLGGDSPPIQVRGAEGTGAFWAGFCWLTDETIVFADPLLGLHRIAARGGSPERLTVVDPDAGERYHTEPDCLPSGDVVMFTVRQQDGKLWSEAVSLSDLERTRIEEVGPYARFLPTGHVVFPRDGTVVVSAFDVARLEVIGSGMPFELPVLPATDMLTSAEPLHMSWSEDGTMVYASSTEAERRASTLVWVDDAGIENRIALPDQVSSHLEQPRLSPDGRFVAVEINRRIWRLDVAENGPPVPLTFGGDQRLPLWAPDGLHVAFAQIVAGAIEVVRVAVDGRDVEPEILTSMERRRFRGTLVPDSWTSEGTLIFSSLDSIWVWSDSVHGQPSLLFESEFVHHSASISPSGDHLAYVSDRSGSPEVWISPWPDVESDRRQVSLGGGEEPRWAPDGRTLFYVDGPRVMASAITADPLRAGEPRFALSRPRDSTASNGWSYDIGPDGRFVFVGDASSGLVPSRLVVVENWDEELTRLVPVD